MVAIFKVFDKERYSRILFDPPGKGVVSVKRYQRRNGGKVLRWQRRIWVADSLNEWYVRRRKKKAGGSIVGDGGGAGNVNVL
jgi:hypothetical protein